MLTKIDEYGKLGWLTVTVGAFLLGWPAGLIVIAFLYGSGRLQAWREQVRTPGAWFNMGPGSFGNAQGKNWCGMRGKSSGNRAFDDYRNVTLRRLEDEQQEFQVFLERLRKARDKAEFDAFMAERRQRPTDKEGSDE